MDANVTLPWMVVLGIFVLGVAVGWLMATVRVRGSVNVSLSPRDVQQGFARSGVRLIKSVNTATGRRLTLKCQCGAVWNFAEGTGVLPADAQPIPTDDSFVCPRCGKSIDLTQERRLETEALKSLNFGNKS